MSTQPVPELKAEDQDPFERYLQNLLKQIESELNQFLIALSVAEETNQAHYARMQRTFVRRTGGRLDDFNEGFRTFNGRILLLGEPGAGKTITLLTQARDAVLARLQDPYEPLPFVAKIAAWDASHPDGEQAFLQLLAKSSGLKTQSIQKELNANNCILFLDGLDDLNSVNRDETTILNPRVRFIMQVPHQNQFLITCRSAEYAQLNFTMRFGGIMELQRLTDEQIHDYLHLIATPTQLWQMLQYYRDLLDIVRTPLALRLFVLAYHDLPNAIQELKYQEQNQLRDMIFEHYIERRYLHELEYYKQRGEDVPFSLEKIYEMLGTIAKHNAVKYGSGLYATGEWAFVPLDDPEWGEWIIISDLPFGFFGADTRKSDEFIKFVSRLQLIKYTENKTCFFTHALFRDYFVLKQSLPIPDVPDSFTIEALGRIKDPRTIQIFAEIICKPIDTYLCIQALQALTSLPFSERLHILFELMDENLDTEIMIRIHDYLSKVSREEIRESVEAWQQADEQAAETYRKYWESYID